jgi:hypothetical protein
MAGFEYVVDTIESTNFGDHGERLRKSHVVVEGETVEDLIARVMPRIRTRYTTPDPTDEIVIRLVDAATKPDADPADPWSIRTNPPTDPF